MPLFDEALDLAQLGTPATPAAGRDKIFFGTDGLPYYVTPTGVVVPFSIGEVAAALHTDASFETWSGGNLTTWSKFWTSGTAAVAQETTDVLFGASSVTVTLSASSSQVLQSSVFDVSPGDTVNVGVWARKVSGAGVLTGSLGLITAPSGTPDFFGPDIGGGESAAETLPSVFTKFGKSFTVPSGHTKARMFFRAITSAAGSAVARYDFSTSSRTGASTAVLPGGTWVKEAVKLVTTAAFTPTTGAPNLIDGWGLTIGDKILKATPGGAATDGIWTVVTVGSGSNGVWARTSDATTASQVAGAEVAVTTGTNHGGSRWVSSFKASDTIGSTVMLWSKVQDVDSGWIVPSYNTNWTDVGAGFQTRRYRKIGNKVRLEGYASRLSTASGASAVILTLPTGYRPAAAQVLQGFHNTGAAVVANQIYIDASGQVIVTLTVAAGVAVPFTGEFFTD